MVCLSLNRRKSFSFVLGVLVCVASVTWAQIGVIPEESPPVASPKELPQEAPSQEVPSQTPTSAIPDILPAENKQPASGVGSVTEELNEIQPSRATLQLVTPNCEINDVESIILRVQGVFGVDIESKKGHLIIDYDPILTAPQKMIDTLARRRGCLARSQ